MDLLNRPSFKSHVEGLLDKHHIPGLSVAVVHKDTFSSAGFGKAQLNSKTNSNSNPSVSTVSNAEQPCTADTLFDIASCSKSFTAAAAGLLVEDDDNFPQVQWDAKMSDLLPEDFVLERDEYTRDVTLEDCLSHRTGLAR
jgi:CubicO group peptidase (beta-lactamase class C family)